MRWTMLPAGERLPVMGHGTVSGLGRILGDLEMDNPSSVVTKNDHGIQQLKRHGRDHEHVNRGDGCHMVPQELRQVVEGALGRRGRCLPTVAWLTSMPSLSNS